MRPPQPPPQGDADQPPREYVTVHEDGTKSHHVKRGHRGETIQGNRHGKTARAQRIMQDMGQGIDPPRRSWQRLKLGGS